jgi:SAM-dependent MidA family methyltransferase
MDNSKRYIVETAKPFADSLIWSINRDYYQKAGVDAWRKNTVPHHMTSNSMVGRTYAELIFACLKDLAVKGQTTETVYILELGAGHGRLAFHILKHLEQLTSIANQTLAPYCYVLSDIVENNLNFFMEHPQFQSYFEAGLLDVSYFDGMESQEIAMRYSGKTILQKDLEQPLLAIGNYFFDSLPTDLYAIRGGEIASCSIGLEIVNDPKEMDEQTLLKELELVFDTKMLNAAPYQENIYNEILEEYRSSMEHTHLFFPQKGLKCVDNLRQMSKKGLMLLSMDKGFHELEDLDKNPLPEIIPHGSFSIWVNYHAFSRFCEKHGGRALFPSYSTFHLELGCMLFMEDHDTYTEIQTTYQRSVDNFGPDDFNVMKQMVYKNMTNFELPHLLAVIRLGAYDATLFKNLLPQIRQLAQKISVKERGRLAETIHQTWNMYFTLNEPFDLAYEIGGLLYDLGYYQEALAYFVHSVNMFGHKTDVFFNKALCHYQLRQDNFFLETVKELKKFSPDYDKLSYLEELNLGAV